MKITPPAPLAGTFSFEAMPGAEPSLERLKSLSPAGDATLKQLALKPQAMSLTSVTAALAAASEVIPLVAPP